MQVGINVWTWGTESKEPFEQAIKEVSDLDYEAVENLGSIVTFYEGCPKELDALMSSHGLKFACAYHHLTGDWESDWTMAKRILKFLGENGISIMNLQAAPRPEGGPTQDDLSETVSNISQIGQFAREQGVTMCLHPHYNTIVERANEIAYVIEHVDRELLHLTLDTAHIVLGGMDPEATFAQYADRVRYVHLKDVVPVRDPVLPWWSGFRELGRGIVDLPAVVDILRDAGFDGVLCVELDNPRICGYKSAAISRRYIREELGL